MYHFVYVCVCVHVSTHPLLHMCMTMKQRESEGDRGDQRQCVC